MPCAQHVYPVCSDATVPGIGDYIVARGRKIISVGVDTKSEDQLIKTEDGINLSNSVPGIRATSEPSKCVPVLEESKFSEESTTSNEPQIQWKFRQIKKKQWKHFNIFSHLNMELNEKLNQKLPFEEQHENKPTQHTDKQNYNELLEKKTKDKLKVPIPVTARKVSKPKKEKSTRGSTFTLKTENRFSCLDDEEILENERFDSENKNKENKFKKTSEKHKDIKRENPKQSKMKVSVREVQKLPGHILKNPKRGLLKPKKSSYVNQTNDSQTQKKRCKNCGHMGYCKIFPFNCKAKGAICKICSKENHFSKGKNCKKRKQKKKNHLSKKNEMYGCQTLREFLRSTHQHLKDGPIRFDNIDQYKIKHGQQINKENTKNINFFCEDILQRITMIENEMKLSNIFSTLPFATKFFLQLYILYNLEFIFCQNKEDKYPCIESFVNVRTSQNEDLASLQKEIDERKQKIEFYRKKLSNGKSFPAYCLIPQYDGDLNSSFPASSEEEIQSIDDMNCSWLYPNHPDNLEDDQSVEHNYNKIGSSGLLAENFRIPQFDGGLDLSFSSSSDDSYEGSWIFSRAQMDGATEMPNDVNLKLAGLISDEPVLKFIVNFFRSLQNHWELFSSHELCRTRKVNTGRRCLFCHVRSVALR